MKMLDLSQMPAITLPSLLIAHLVIRTTLIGFAV
jgi:hypothetical protein